VIFYVWLVFYFVLHFLIVSLFFLFLIEVSFVLRFDLCQILRVNFCYSLIFDFYSVGFYMFVVLISGVVIFYRKIYLRGDLFFVRFLNLVNLFVLSMGLLVFRPNMISVMLGWDGLGVISFLLVIYYQNSFSLKSGLVTIFTNRFGDVFIIFSLVLIFDFGFFNVGFYMEK